MLSNNQNQLFKQASDVRSYMIHHGKEVKAKIVSAAHGMIHHVFEKSQDAQDFLRWLKTDSPLDRKEKQQMEMNRIQVMPSSRLPQFKDLPECFLVSISEVQFNKLDKQQDKKALRK
jgi:hypothetical protein